MTAGPAAGRDQPLIAIDVVPVAFTADRGLVVATARRAYDPYAGLEALPGVLLDGSELLADGARRALRTKAGVDAPAVRHLAQVGTFDGPDRDPRSTAISVSFVAVLRPGAADGDDITWTSIGALSGLPFDHDRIVRAAAEHMRTRLWGDRPMTSALLGDPFPTTAASRLVADLTGAAPDPGNLNRALRTNPDLDRANPPADRAARGGRPPAYWSWRAES